VNVWDADDGSQTTVFEAPDDVHSVTWLKGEHIAFVGGEPVVYAWDTARNEPQRLTVLLPDERSAIFGPSGRLLGASGDIDDDLVYMIEMPDGGRELIRPSEFSQRWASAPAR
jgi:hypothetical protein